VAIKQALKNDPTDNDQTTNQPEKRTMKIEGFHQTVRATALAVLALLIFASPFSLAQEAITPVNTAPLKLVLPAGVERVCSISFDKDLKRPARVEDSALPCLEEVATTLKKRPDRKIVLVGVSDPVKDHEEKDAGEEREGEDMTGLDIRYEDTSAYRAVNTKNYLVRFYGISPERLLPTTNENRHGQDVTFYLVPGDADFLHNYLNTTRTNEHPCTVKPCYDPREESDTAQPRGRIPPQPNHQK
jgi:hypothetical protein